MNTPLLRRLLRLAAVLALAGVPLSGLTAQPAATKSTAETGRQPKKRIYVGMPAAELEALIGKPVKIVPVKSDKAKSAHAEVWIYRRLLKTITEDVPIGTKPIMGRRQSGDGSWSDVVLSNETVTKRRQTDVYQVASFLIIEGKYVACTLAEEKSQSYF